MEPKKQKIEGKRKKSGGGIDYSKWDKLEDETMSSDEGRKISLEQDTSQHVIRLRQKRALHIKEKANGLFRMGLFEDSFVLYSQCIELDPSNPIFYSNRAEALIRMESYDAAIFDCQIALQKDPRHWKAHFRLNTIYQKLGKYDLALKELDEILLLKENFSYIIEIRQELEALISETAVLDSFQNLVDGNPSHSHSRCRSHSLCKYLIEIEKLIETYRHIESTSKEKQNVLISLSKLFSCDCDASGDDDGNHFLSSLLLKLKLESSNNDKKEEGDDETEINELEKMYVYLVWFRYKGGIDSLTKHLLTGTVETFRCLDLALKFGINVQYSYPAIPKLILSINSSWKNKSRNLEKTYLIFSILKRVLVKHPGRQNFIFHHGVDSLLKTIIHFINEDHDHLGLHEYLDRVKIVKYAVDILIILIVSRPVRHLIYNQLGELFSCYLKLLEQFDKKRRMFSSQSQIESQNENENENIDMLENVSLSFATFFRCCVPHFISAYRESFFLKFIISIFEKLTSFPIECVNRFVSNVNKNIGVFEFLESSINPLNEWIKLLTYMFTNGNGKDGQKKKRRLSTTSSSSINVSTKNIESIPFFGIDEKKPNICRKTFLEIRKSSIFSILFDVFGVIYGNGFLSLSEKFSLIEDGLHFLDVSCHLEIQTPFKLAVVLASPTFLNLLISMLNSVDNIPVNTVRCSLLNILEHLVHHQSENVLHKLIQSDVTGHVVLCFLIKSRPLKESAVSLLARLLEDSKALKYIFELNAIYELIDFWRLCPEKSIEKSRASTILALLLNCKLSSSIFPQLLSSQELEYIFRYLQFHNSKKQVKK